MNNRGQTIFFILMLGVLFFVLALALAPSTNSVVSEAMDHAFLDCSNSSISDQNKAVCTSLDITSFLFTGVIFGLAGILIGGVAVR